MGIRQKRRIVILLLLPGVVAETRLPSFLKRRRHAYIDGSRSV